MEKPQKCPECHLDVSPGDREKVVNHHGTWHGNCWRKVKKIKDELDQVTAHDAGMGIWKQ